MKEIDWKADIEQLKNQLPKLHKNFFYKTTEEQFYKGIEALQEQQKQMNAYSIVMELARIVATAKDAHTAVMLPQFERLPFDCYCFQEGLYITTTNQENKALLHAKIVKIEKHDTKSICEKLTALIAHENKQFLLAAIPKFFTCVDILYGLNILQETEYITLTIQNQEGKILKRKIRPLSYDAYTVDETPTSGLPLYRQHREKFYWSHLENGILYVNYKKCKNMEGFPVEEFCNQLKKEITENLHIEKLVLDLRNNTGGNSTLFQPFLSWIAENKRLNQKGKLYAIVGRDTFSSALLNIYFLKHETEAIFIGEATGGKPNCYGEVKYLVLEQSGLYIRYSTKYYAIIEDHNQPYFVPDIEIAVNFIDYAKAKDGCMHYIKRKEESKC